MTRRPSRSLAEQIINESSVVDAHNPVTCKEREIGTQMMWLEQWATFDLEIYGIITETH
jgi:hypothetical protein